MRNENAVVDLLRRLALNLDGDGFSINCAETSKSLQKRKLAEVMALVTSLKAGNFRYL
jgi:hypothetical protein